MTRIMWDGISADARYIKDAWKPGDLVAGYVPPNQYAWLAWQWAMFPESCHVTITTDPAIVNADALDIEDRAAKPADAYTWIAEKKNAGYYRPTVYCSLSKVPLVRALTGRLVLGQDYDLWVADWDGTSVIPYPHVAAKQAESTTRWDKSFVYDDAWPHRVKPEPVIPVQPVRLSGVLNLQWSRVVADVDHYVVKGPGSLAYHPNKHSLGCDISYREGEWEVFAVVSGRGPVPIMKFTLP